MTKANVFYIWGKETYLVDNEIDRTIKELKQQDNEEPEIVFIDSDEMTPAELGQALEFNPLFSLRRVVIMKNPFWLGKQARKSKRIDEFNQVIKICMENNPEEQVLVFTSIEHNNTNPTVKMLEKKARVINVKDASRQYLESWIKNEFESKNRTVAPVVYRQILNSGQDMYYLKNFIDKICLMVPSGKTIEIEDIGGQLDSIHNTNIFKFIDALLNRNIKGALHEFYQLLEQGEAVIYILFMVNRQFFIYSKVKFYREQGYSPKQIEEITGQKEYTVKKMLEKNAKFTWQEIRRIFNLMLEVDINLKSTGKDSRISMETLIIEFCAKK